MSSWKKASKANQKTHRERHQPDNRAHLGLLEKKKDYRKRAYDHHKKEKILKILKKKVLNKNPDEFYMHMVNSKIIGGKHRDKIKADKHTPEQIKLMETKDMRYIEYKRTIESRKIEKVQSSLHMIDAANKIKNTHVFFVDSPDEVKDFDLAQRLDTHPELLDRKINRLRTSLLKNIDISEIDKKALDEKNKSYSELEKRMYREKELMVVQQKLQVKKNLKDKKIKKPKQVKPGTKDAPPVYKWEYERKK